MKSSQHHASLKYVFSPEKSPIATILITISMMNTIPKTQRFVKSPNVFCQHRDGSGWPNVAPCLSFRPRHFTR